jgi:NADH-quinone oxidoreductase subunit M
MGGYGMIRVSVSIFPETAERYALLFVVIAVISVIYGAALTLRQTDLKKLIAYSSVSHMGFVLLGIFALTEVSMTGAVLQMVSHGVITGLLFAMVGLVYYKTHERSIPRLGGLVRQMPVIAVVFSIAGFAALGLPGTSGFAAEVITFVGSYGSTMVSGIEIFTILAITGVVFGAGYILWMLRRVFYGPPWDEFNGVPDADRLEKVYIFAFVAVIMLIGLYPVIFTDVIKMGIQPIVGIFNG